MRIGIDFDNTIICYDRVFSTLAKTQQLVGADFSGSKRELREKVWLSAEGDIAWQRLQGKAYGEGISLAEMFNGFKEFVAACNLHPNVEIFIVSHKTEFGHFDEKRINLRDAALGWLRAQGFFEGPVPHIKEQQVFFAPTREEKISKIRALQCTHFIDDLPEVLFAPTFPDNVKRFLFNPDENQEEHHEGADVFSNWIDIKNAIFAN